MNVLSKLLLILFTSFSTIAPSHTEVTRLPEPTQVKITASDALKASMTQQADMISKAIQSAKSKKEIETILSKAFNEKALNYQYLYYGNVKSEFTVVPKEEIPSDYDCCKRPYYLNAVKQGYYFDEIYEDILSAKHILTLSKAVYSNGKLIGVLGIDVILD